MQGLLGVRCTVAGAGPWCAAGGFGRLHGGEAGEDEEHGCDQGPRGDSVLLLTGWPGIIASCFVDAGTAKGRKGLPHPYATLVVVAAPDTLAGIAVK